MRSRPNASFNALRQGLSVASLTATARVGACLKEAKANCAEATCAWQAERTMTACTE